MSLIGRYRVLSVKKPGQNGTKTLLAKYGDRLRCVRYLEDRLTGERLKTAEVLEETHHQPLAGLKSDHLVGIKVAMHEKELRAKIKALGGCWNQYDKVWILRYGDLERLGLKHRKFIISEEAGKYAAH